MGKLTKEELKPITQKEILALLDDNIESELDAMGDCYTVAEIAREVLLSFDTKTLL